MTADIPSVLSKDGIDGLGAVPSVLEESRTDGTVDNTDCIHFKHARDQCNRLNKGTASASLATAGNRNLI